MIRTFEKKTVNRWSEVVVVNTETNEFEQFCYQIVKGKLVRFSEHKTTNNAHWWIKERCKELKYTEVQNDFLDSYPLWNPAIDFTEEIRKQYSI